MNNIIDLNNSQCVGFADCLIGQELSYVNYERDKLLDAGLCPYCLEKISDCWKAGQPGCISILDGYNTSGEKLLPLVKMREKQENSSGSFRLISQIEYPAERQTEIYRFSRKIAFGIRPPQLVLQKKEVQEVSKSVRLASSSRRRNTIRRLIEANLKKKGNKLGFLTLTFSPFNPVKFFVRLLGFLYIPYIAYQDIKLASIPAKFSVDQVNKFIKKLNYFLSHDDIVKPRYIWVKEYQKLTKAPHFHILFFDWSYVKAEKLRQMWGNGSLKIEKIWNVKRVGRYVSKYLGKEQSFFKGDRLWSHSQNCIKIKRVLFEEWQMFSGKVFDYYFSRSTSGERISYFYKYTTWNCFGSSFPRKI